MGEIEMPSAKFLTRNGLVFVAVAVAYFVYMRFVANALPDSWGGEVNVFVAPFLVGVIGAFAFAGAVWMRLVLVAAAVALVLLMITGSGDAAKPGLHLWVTGGMVLIALLGMLCAVVVKHMIGRRTPAN